MTNRYEKDCDGMPRDELEKRFVALQVIAKSVKKISFSYNAYEWKMIWNELSTSLAKYEELEKTLSHDD